MAQMQRSSCQIQPGAIEITDFGVPTPCSSASKELSFDLKVMRDLDFLISRGVEAAPPSHISRCRKSRK
ncbi:hypothetical protein [Deinococcus rubellus]|uniref:hypothetical protein n=1 Tax=Deinococcus rubellus TaxID=1889240 RepID=UPI0031ED2166